MDVLVLLEGYLKGRISGLPCRPQPKERQALVRSGNILIFDEQASGMKRWTDGMPWGPSRKLGEFLVYHELETSSGPMRESAYKQNSPRLGNCDTAEVSTTMANNYADLVTTFVGSFANSLPIRLHGHVKRSINIEFRDRIFHVVSYFRIEDVKSGALLAPAENPCLHGIVPRAELLRSWSIWKHYRGPGDQGISSLIEGVYNHRHDLGENDREYIGAAIYVPFGSESFGIESPSDALETFSTCCISPF